MKTAEIVRTSHCKTVEEFLHSLSRRGPLFRSFLPGRWIFRGHEDDERFGLVPSALPNNSKQLVDLALKTIA
jgi:hypothetical protein